MQMKSKDRQAMNTKALFKSLLLLAAGFLAACQQGKIEDPVKPDVPEAPADSVWTLTIQAAKKVDTKALDLTSDGSTLNAYWKDTEKVKVYKEGTLLGQLDVTPDTGEKPVTATLSGSITVEGLAQGDNLTLMIPRESWDYTGQTGTLAEIESNYDYATATVSVSEISGQAVTTTAADFQNQQSVYRFGFKAGENYIGLKDFTVSAAGGKLVQGFSLSGNAWTPAYGSLSVAPAATPADGFYYVALRNEQTTADTYSFVMTGSDDALYTATKAIPTSVLATPGRFISAKTIEAVKPNFAPAPSGTIEAPENVL